MSRPPYFGGYDGFREQEAKYSKDGALFADDRPVIAVWYYYPVAAVGFQARTNARREMFPKVRRMMAGVSSWRHRQQQP